MKDGQETVLLSEREIIYSLNEENLEYDIVLIQHFDTALVAIQIFYR